MTWKALGLAVVLLAAGCLGAGSDADDPDATNDTDRGAATGPTAAAPAGPPDNATLARPGAPGPGGFSDTHVFEGNYTRDAFFSRVLHEGPHDRLPPELVSIEGPVDGVPVAIELHRPDVPDGTRVPVIVQASPYYEDDPPRLPGDVTEGDTYASEGLYSPALVGNYVPHGYAVALVALRGTADSGGCWDTLGPATGTDLDRAITWLANRSWSNGAVGVVGAFSQDGAAAWQTAATGNPHVRTVVPVAAWADHYGVLFRNGSWNAQSPTFWATAAKGATTNTEPPADLDEAAVAPTRARCPGAAEGPAASVHAVAAGAGDPTGYWAERDLREDLRARYNGSVFLVHGLRDPAIVPSNAYPLVHRLEDEGRPVKQLLGQWAHVVPDVRLDNAFSANPTPRLDFAEVLLHWLDYWLKGDTTRDLGPRVQVADADGRWRSADAWPPVDATSTTLYLHPDATIAREPADETGTERVGPDAGDALPQAAPDAVANLVPCPDCLVLETDPLEEALRFAGSPRLDLTVTPAGPGGYLTAQLLQAGQDGTARVLTTGQVDLRFAADGRSAAVVEPGERMAAPLALEPQDARLGEGDRLVLRIAQGSPGGDPTWQTLPGVPPTPVDVHLGGGQSTLALESFDVAPGTVFEPPASS